MSRGRKKKAKANIESTQKPREICFSSKVVMLSGLSRQEEEDRRIKNRHEAILRKLESAKKKLCDD